MARKGINSTHSVYYGRGRKKGRRLLILLLVLLITAGVLAGGYFYLQEHIVYTADGFYFDFPFLSGKEPTTPGDVPLVVDDGSEKEEEGNKDPEDKDEEETPPESAPTVTAMEGDLSRIGDANYRSQLMNQAWNAGCGALVFTVKEEGGRVGIPTDSAIAQQAGSAQPYDGVAEGLTELKEAGFSLTARLSACRDNIVPRALRDNALRTQSGAVWMDYDNITWLAPSGPQTGEYIGQLLTSCQSLGFDGVILSDLGYPPRGKTDLIVTDKGADKQALTIQLLQQLQQAAGEMTVTVELGDTAAQSLTDAMTGQNPMQLREYCDALLVNAQSETDAFVQNLITQVEDGSSCRIALALPEGSAVPQGRSCYLG